MEQRIFAQLDQLERGARVTETRPDRHAYNDSSVEYSAYDDYGADYDHHDRAYGAYQPRVDQYDRHSMVNDTFDEELLRRPHHATRQEQSVRGQARLSHMPEGMLPDGRREAYESSRGLQLSRFAFEPGQAETSSPSPFERPVQSSPAFKASQRRPSGYEYEVEPRGPRYRSPPRGHGCGATASVTGAAYLGAEERDHHPMQDDMYDTFTPSYDTAQPTRPKQTTRASPIIQGITLVSTHDLPDRFRSIFSFPLFNAVQSKCFDTIYKTSDNFVLSAPTGSGKTAILELAICRLINGFTSGSFKIVYQAPTKSLCSERQRDWQAKFGPLDLQCAELTGDTENAQLRNVQHATIIITTPEKWDSMTRKWKDHQKLMQMVKLFLIDEVHILKEERGATLEAVVSRMKSIGSDVRFVALSATVPNSNDISTWLGKDPTNPHLPAPRERFGEEFRPVRLQKHVCGYQTTSNDFAFEKTLNAKLPDVIQKWSQRKPIMVFCFTRASCVETAKLLTNWWATKGPKERFWSPPRKRLVVGDKDLRDTISSGVAFHHAGLQIQDRTAVEKGYLEGDVNVICCTSTLAVGVNLPCHMVIIKNTVTYQSAQAGGLKEYSDLEIMQMLGRAGRPQFDDSAVAVIMTKLQRVQYYEKMITGQELLESCLHRNLIDHLNAEIGLGTITSASSAKKWLSSTFLYVRLKEHPEHYKLDGGTSGRTLDERLENICSNGIARLEEHDLVQATPKLHCTEFGDAMARYYVQFDTMKVFLALAPQSKMSEILSAVSQAAEFADIRFRAGEKPTYKTLNGNGSIKFPIPVNLDAPAHKVSLIIQSVLGAVDLPTEDQKQRTEYAGAKATIFQHAHRLVRCIIDCQLYLEDAVTTRNVLMLARSLGAQVWDDSPMHMKQLDGVGLVTVRKLVQADIKSVEDIECTEAHRLETILSRNPPFGTQLQEKAKAFPKLRISLKMVGEPVVKKGELVAVKLRAELGFLNEKIPETFQRRAVYVCMLAETSDGHKVHFARISAKKLNKGQEILFSANLTNAGQTVRAYVMCDDIAGTGRHALLKPEIPLTVFPPQKSAAHAPHQQPQQVKRKTSANKARSKTDSTADEFGDAGIDDADLALVEAGGFVDIDEIDMSGKPPNKKRKTSHNTQVQDDWEPRQLSNGKWACNHTCKDKTACKHLCCRDGLDKKPKPPKPKESKKQTTELGSDPKQTQLSMSVGKKTALPTPAASSNVKAATSSKGEDSREMRDLNRLHNSVKSATPKVPLIGKGKPTSKGGQSRLSFLEAAREVEDEAESSDYGIDTWHPSDLPNDITATQSAGRNGPPQPIDDFTAPEDDMLDDTVYGDADVEARDGLGSGNGDGYVNLSSYTSDTPDKAYEPSHQQRRKSSDDLFVTDGVNHDEAVNTRPAHDEFGRSPEQTIELTTVPTLNDEPPRPSTAQRRQELEEAMQPVMEEVFSGEAPGEEQVEDTVEWFKREFGTEYFNIIP